MKMFSMTASILGLLLALGRLADPQAEKGQKPEEKERAAQGGAQGFERASQLLGKEVKDQRGETLGTFEDVVLDEKRARIAFAVVSLSKVEGLGDKYFAIPWEALRRQNNHFVLMVDREKLRQAPGFARGEWPDWSDRRWTEEIYRFYGVRPTTAATDPSARRDDERRDEQGRVEQQRRADQQRRDDQPRADQGRERRQLALERRAMELPLKLEQGKSHRYRIENHPADEARQDLLTLEYKVTQARGQETVLEGSYQQGNERENFRARVAKDGKVMDVTPTTSQGKEEEQKGEGFRSQHLRLHLQHVLGFGLHEGRLEPGQAMHFPAALHGIFRVEEGSQNERQERRGAQARDRGREAAETDDPGSWRYPAALRYDGTGEVEGVKVAYFTLIKQERLGGREQARASADGMELGWAAFRLDDGLMERFVVERHPDAPERGRQQVGEEIRIRRID